MEDYSKFGFALKEGDIVYKNSNDNKNPLPGVKPFSAGFYLVDKIRTSLFSKRAITEKNAKDEFVYVLIKCSSKGKRFKSDFPILVSYIDELVKTNEIEVRT